MFLECTGSFIKEVTVQFFEALQSRFGEKLVIVLDKRSCFTANKVKEFAGVRNDLRGRRPHHSGAGLLRPVIPATCATVSLITGTAAPERSVSGSESDGRSHIVCSPSCRLPPRPTRFVLPTSRKPSLSSHGRCAPVRMIRETSGLSRLEAGGSAPKSLITRSISNSKERTYPETVKLRVMNTTHVSCATSGDRTRDRAAIYIYVNNTSNDIVSFHFVECHRTLTIRVRRQPAFRFPGSLINRVVTLVPFVLDDGQGLVQPECQRSVVCLDGRLDSERVLRGDSFIGVE